MSGRSRLASGAGERTDVLPPGLRIRKYKLPKFRQFRSRLEWACTGTAANCLLYASEHFKSRSIVRVMRNSELSAAPHSDHLTALLG
jgi:hypothetical protein